MKEFGEEDEDLALVFRALGHPVRLSIMRFLVSCNMSNCCCNDVTESLPLAQSTVSQHIKVLLDAGLIERRQQGTRNCYCVNTTKISQVEAIFAGFLDELKMPPKVNNSGLTESA